MYLWACPRKRTRKRRVVGGSKLSNNTTHSVACLYFLRSRAAQGDTALGWTPPGAVYNSPAGTAVPIYSFRISAR